MIQIPKDETFKNDSGEDLKLYKNSEVDILLDYQAHMDFVLKQIEYLPNEIRGIHKVIETLSNPYYFYDIASIDNDVKAQKELMNYLEQVYRSNENFLNEYPWAIEDCFEEGSLEKFKETFDSIRRLTKEMLTSIQNYEVASRKVDINSLFTKLLERHNYEKSKYPYLIETLFEKDILSMSSDGTLTIYQEYKNIPSLEKFVRELNGKKSEEELVKELNNQNSKKEQYPSWWDIRKYLP